MVVLNHQNDGLGSPEAKIAYARFVAELQSNPVTCGTVQRTYGADVLVAELAADFFRHIQNSVRKCREFRYEKSYR